MLAIANHTVKNRFFTGFLRQVATDLKYIPSHEKVRSKNEIKRYESKQIAKGRVKHSGVAHSVDDAADFRKEQ